MKKKHIITIGITLIFLSYFIGRNYQSFLDKNNPKYEKIDSTQIQYIYNQKVESEKIKIKVRKKTTIPNIKPKTIKKEIPTQRTNTKQTTPKATSNAILKFKSSNFDYEDATDILFTKYETSYHTLNFNNNTITLKSKLGTDEWKTLVYKWKGFHDPYRNGYIEFEIINDGTIYQIWRSTLNNFGYEMKNGTKYVFYDVNQIN
jgi:hypothetical protein